MIKIIYQSAFKVYILFFIVACPAIAGVKNTNVFRWQNVNKDYMIDTVDTSVDDNEIKLWVKLKGYSKLRLILDCNDFTYRKEFDGVISISKPINGEKTTFLIAKQLCFLTGLEGFSKERRKPKWVKKIIKTEQLKLEKIKLIESSKLNSESRSKPNIQTQINTSESVKPASTLKIPKLIRE